MPAIPGMQKEKTIFDCGQNYTPLRGKAAFVEGWTKQGMTYDEARNYAGATGVGIIHAETCCIDMDNVEAITNQPALAPLLGYLQSDHLQITSPNTNSAKLVFKLPPNTHLSYVATDGGEIELRSGPGHQDALPGSDYPEKRDKNTNEIITPAGKYGSTGTLQEIPNELLEWWRWCEQYRDKQIAQYTSNAEIEPLTKAGMHSVIYWYNWLHSIEEILTHCPSFEEVSHNRWTYVDGTGTGGVVLYEAQQTGREGMRVAKVYHGSMGALTGRIVDAFELAAWVSGGMPETDEELQKARSLLIAKQAQEIKLDFAGELKTINAANQEIKSPAPLTDEYAAMEAEEHSLHFDNLPDDVVAPPNDRFGDLVRQINASRYKPNLMTAHLAALGVVAQMAGGKYRAKNKASCRVFAIGVGDSSCGKGTIVESPGEVLSYLSMEDSRAHDAYKGYHRKVATAEGLEDLLSSYPDMLLCWDEYGHAVRDASMDAKSHRARVFHALLELWPMAGKLGRTRVLADKDKESKPLFSPHVTMIGGTTEDILSSGLSYEDISQGFSARTTLFPVTQYARPLRREVDDLTLDKSIVKALGDLYICHGVDHVPKDLQRIHKPKIVPVNEDASQRLYDIAVKVDTMRAGMYKALAGRLQLNVSAWALCRALINNPSNPRMTLEYVEWAYKIVHHSVLYQCTLFNGKVSDSPVHSAMEAVKRKLTKYKGRWIKERELKNLRPLRRLGLQAHPVINEFIARYGEEMEIHSKDNSNGSETRSFKWVGIV